MIQLILSLFVLAGCWRIFQKMGRQGWEGIVPLYNGYVLCQILYGQGWRLLLFLVPLYNIYFAIKLHIDLAKSFHQGVGFGLGLTFLPMVFYPLLGFGSFTCGSGAQATRSEDPISRTLDQMANAVNGQGGSTGTQSGPNYQEQSQAWKQYQSQGQQTENREENHVPQGNPAAASQEQKNLDMLRQLDSLHKAGVLSDEEYRLKKQELLDRI